MKVVFNKEKLKILLHTVAMMPGNSFANGVSDDLSGTNGRHSLPGIRVLPSKPLDVVSRAVGGRPLKWNAESLTLNQISAIGTPLGDAKNPIERVAVAPCRKYGNPMSLRKPKNPSISASPKPHHRVPRTPKAAKNSYNLSKMKRAHTSSSTIENNDFLESKTSLDFVRTKNLVLKTEAGMNYNVTPKPGSSFLSQMERNKLTVPDHLGIPLLKEQTKDRLNATSYWKQTPIGPPRLSSANNSQGSCTAANLISTTEMKSNSSFVLKKKITDRLKAVHARSMSKTLVQNGYKVTSSKGFNATNSTSANPCVLVPVPKNGTNKSEVRVPSFCGPLANGSKKASVVGGTHRGILKSPVVQSSPETSIVAEMPKRVVFRGPERPRLEEISLDAPLLKRKLQDQMSACNLKTKKEKVCAPAINSPNFVASPSASVKPEASTILLPFNPLDLRKKVMEKLSVQSPSVVTTRSTSQRDTRSSSKMASVIAGESNLKQKNNFQPLAIGVSRGRVLEVSKTPITKVQDKSESKNLRPTNGTHSYTRSNGLPNASTDAADLRPKSFPRSPVTVSTNARNVPPGSNIKTPDRLSVPSLGERMMERLKGARFRHINENLYTISGSDAVKFFADDHEAFNVYHEGYQSQMAKWPVHPLDLIIKNVKKMPQSVVIADFGCGDARLATSVPHKVHSFDIVARNKHVVACNMEKVPLPDESVNMVVFCLSLMGTSLTAYLVEANRVLKMGGLLNIAEVESRFTDIPGFIGSLRNLGFSLLTKNMNYKMFIMLSCVKVKNCSPKTKTKVTLKPCLYKRR